MTDHTDHFELAIYLTGDTETWKYATEWKYGIEYEDFCKLIDELLPLIEMGESPFTKKLNMGFADKANRAWLARVEVSND